jgi:hypothetical protein
MHNRSNTPTNNSLWTRFFLSFVICCTILAPGIVLSKNQPSLRVEDPLILLAFFYLLAKKTGGVNKIIFGRKIRPFAIPYLLLTLWILTVTITMSLPSLNLITFLSTAISFLSTMKALLIAIVIINLSKDSITVKTDLYIIMACLAIELLIVYAQANNLFDIHEWLTPLYRRDRRFNSAASRIGGTYGNPNSAAVAIAAMLSLVVSKFTFEVKPFHRIFLIIIIIFSFYSVVAFTGSRTGMLMCIIAISMPFLILMFLRKHRKKALILTIGIFVIQCSLPSILNNSKWSKRYINFTNIESIDQSLEDPSFTARVANWESIFNNMQNDILGGKGLLSRESWIVTDNGYVSVFLYGGLVGLCFYIWFLLYPAIIMLNHLFRLNSTLPFFDIVLLSGGITCISILIIASITVPIYANAKLNATFMIIIALSLNSIPSTKAMTARGKPVVGDMTKLCTQARNKRICHD